MGGEKYVWPGSGKTKTVIVDAGKMTHSRAHNADDTGPKLRYLVYTGCHTWP